ncbi:MFS transporter [Sunxiuqinia indica]|uniref:MFS transporter n=1 Tax=Sunxiuqinia indica TaxID=2692584 RepID=UPI001359FC43|nr:MFS transporter [Sunxiuqinia indica]
MLKLFKKEYDHFTSFPRNMRILLLTNLIYALVLPILELFVGAYILRQSDNTSYVVVYQLMVYLGIPVAFLVNGMLLRRIKIARLYSLGMLMSGVAMTIMMMLDSVDIVGISISGLVMGCSYGFFWANRDFLSLSSTNDSNRNYYFSMETFFYTITFIFIPAIAGYFIATGEEFGWYPAKAAYITLTVVVFGLTIFSSIMVHQGDFDNPKNERFIFFKFHKDWNWMLLLGGFKGIAQAAIFFFPILLILSFVGKEGSLGGLVAVGSIITALVLYLIGRFSRPEHRIYVFSFGLLVFLMGGMVNSIFFSAIGVVIYQICNSLSRPLLDAAYYPIQLGVIDHISELEKRNKFAYIFNHEAGLFVGRMIGCLLFLIASEYASPEFALRYVLVIIALIQALSIPVAQMLIKKVRNYKKA